MVEVKNVIMRIKLRPICDSPQVNIDVAPARMDPSEHLRAGTAQLNACALAAMFSKELAGTRAIGVGKGDLFPLHWVQGDSPRKRRGFSHEKPSR